jgi:hypothetical protein
MVEFCDGVNYGIAFQFLDHPSGFCVRKGLRNKMYWTELVVDDLEENGAYTEVGGVSVKIDGLGVVEVKVFDGCTNGCFEGGEGSGPSDLEGRASEKGREGLREFGVISDKVAKEIAKVQGKSGVLSWSVEGEGQGIDDNERDRVEYPLYQR